MHKRLGSREIGVELVGMVELDGLWRDVEEPRPAGSGTRGDDTQAPQELAGSPQDPRHILPVDVVGVGAGLGLRDARGRDGGVTVAAQHEDDDAEEAEEGGREGVLDGVHDQGLDAPGQVHDVRHEELRGPDDRGGELGGLDEDPPGQEALPPVEAHQHAADLQRGLVPLLLVRYAHRFLSPLSSSQEGLDLGDLLGRVHLVLVAAAAHEAPDKSLHLGSEPVHDDAKLLREDAPAVPSSDLLDVDRCRSESHT